jgi:hypothetical protein
MKAADIRSWYIGFKCGRCGYPIPVVARSAAAVSFGKLRVMCPQCGTCESHDRSQAYSFQARLDPSSPQASG